MKTTQEYIEENRARFLDELLELLKIPSISADPKFKDDVAKTATAVADSLRNAGCSKVEVFQTKGHPIVYGEHITDPGLPTVLVYGHYDVQPPDPLDLWDSPPFEPVIKKTAIHPDGAIFARGSCDDKGQFFMHVKAFEAMVRTGTLAVNVKFLIEGEEEVGSSNLGDFCRENKKMLACDMVIISDTSVLANDTPSITVGLRGLSYVEVEVTGPNKDLHSGVYGGAVANPAQVLCDMIASLKDENKHITIPGFYDDVVEVTASERAAMNMAPFKEGRVDLTQLNDYLTERTKLFAFTAMSNVFGTINPTKELVAAAHRVGALALVDAAQSVPHLSVDVQDLNCDFLVFSGHKMCGHTGIGIL